MTNIYKKIKISWTYPTQPTSLQIGTVKIYRGTSEFTLDNVLSQIELVSQEYDPTFTSFTDDFELEYDITYYYMIIVYGDIDSTISAATSLYSTKIETPEATIPSNEIHFTTTEGTIDYYGVFGDQLVFSDGTTVTLDEDYLYDIAAPDGKHKVVLKEPREASYVGLGGEALVELHNFPTLSSVDTFDTCPNNTSPNLVKVPTVLPSNITHTQYMFNGANSFNQDISGWDVSNVTDMRNMFRSTNSFNQDISGWDVSNVTDMSYMFGDAVAFDQPLNNWDTSNVTNMDSMFRGASAFNQPLNDWDVSNVDDMNSMFSGAFAFNHPLNNWNVSNVTDMGYMFTSAFAFNQDLSQWCVSNITDPPMSFDYDATNWTLPRPVWGTCPVSMKPYFEWYYWEGGDDFGFTLDFPTPVEVHYPNGEVEIFIAHSGVNSLSYQEGLYRVVGDFDNLLTDAYLHTSPINSAPSTPIVTSYVRLQNDMVEISGTATPNTVACLYDYEEGDDEIAFSPVDALGQFTLNVKLPPNFSWYIRGRRGTRGSAETTTYVV